MCPIFLPDLQGKDHFEKLYLGIVIHSLFHNAVPASIAFAWFLLVCSCGRILDFAPCFPQNNRR